MLVTTIFQVMFSPTAAWRPTGWVCVLPDVKAGAAVMRPASRERSLVPAASANGTVRPVSRSASLSSSASPPCPCAVKNRPAGATNSKM